MNPIPGSGPSPVPSSTRAGCRSWSSVAPPSPAARGRLWAHPARVLGELFDQLCGRVSGQDLTPNQGGEDPDLDPLLLPEIEGRVLVVLQEEGTRLARYVVRHAGVAGVGISAGARSPVDGPGYGLFAPAYALLPDEDGHQMSLLVEVGELGPEAEEALLRGRSMGKVDPIVRLLYFGLETQPSACNRREGERVAYSSLAISVFEASGDHQFCPALFDAVYGLVGMQLSYLVFEGEVCPRLVDRLFSLGRRDETFSGDALPQYPLRPGAVRNAENEVGRVST